MVNETIRRLSLELFDYQPGNCTRYMILARKIKRSNYDPADLAFFWLLRGDRGGQGMILDSNDEMHLDYFQEKTGIHNECDAVALLCFLRDQFGVEILGIPDSYRRERWFLGTGAP